MSQIAPAAAPLPVPAEIARDTRYASDDGMRWVNFGDLMRIVMARRKIVLVTAAVIVATATAFAFLATPLYDSSASVMIDEQQKDVVDINAVMAGVPSDPSSIESQASILQSRTLAGQVVDKLGLMKDPEFNATLKPSLLSLPQWLNPRSWFSSGGDDGLPQAQKVREGVIDKFLKHLDVNAVGHSTVIDVDFLAQSPVKSARIADAVVNTYVQNQVTAKDDATRSASSWLTKRVNQLAAQSRAADQAVAQYKADNGLVDMSTGTSALDLRVGNLDNQIVLAEANRAQEEAKLARVQQLVSSGHSDAVSAVVDSPLIAQLRQQQASLVQEEADMSSRYGPKNPKMLEIEAQKRDLSATIDEEVKRVVGTVASDASAARAQESVLEGSLAQAKAEGDKQNQARVKLADLVANATAIQNLYQTFLQRLRQTQEQMSLNIPTAHVMSAAAIPLSASFPKKTLIIGAAIPAGLMLGFLLALVMDRLGNGFRTPDEVEAALGLHVLVTIPELKRSRSPVRDVAAQVVSKPLSAMSETIRGLQMRLALANDSRPKVIVVTSALPGEGKTAVATSLARQAALSGLRTVLVDGDLRRPNVHAALGINDFRRGLVNYLDHECMLDDALVPDPRSPLMTLPAKRTRNAPDLIASHEMEDLISKLRTIADLVIIDSPPVLAVNDANLLAHFADTTVFVVRWDKTPREVAVQAVRTLREVGAKLAGAALMRADQSRYQYYNYGCNTQPAYAKYFEN